jgi:MFS family permease
MSVRGRYIPAAIGWTVLVAGLLAIVPASLAHRLPDPVASHWGPSGAPDDSMPLALMTVLPLLIWLALAGGALGTMIWGATLRRRRSRSVAVATLLGGGVFTLGLAAVTIYANLDRSDWRQAAPIGWQMFLVLALAVLAGLAGWLLGRLGPDEPPESIPRPALRTRLRPGQHAVWVSSLAVPWAVALAVGFLIAAVVLGTLSVVRGDVRGEMAVIFAVVALVGLTLSTVRAQVDRRGLAIAFGPLRWPVRRVPLARIESAWVEVRRPGDVGGWGYRGLPGGATIMLRGGECLVVRYVSGGTLAVSVDDAERGAALLNELINEHAADRR